MSETTEISALSHRELIELWTVTFGEPPPLVYDPPLMLALVEAALIAGVEARALKRASV